MKQNLYVSFGFGFGIYLYITCFCYIAVDKVLFQLNVLIFCLFFPENICCGYSLEAPWGGGSNKYPQHMFLWRNQKNIYLIHSFI